ncbi:hypothetical protein [Actinomadura rugatobispora]|uniref:Uncharacterized protein n=1 Tax=Actinomadura rugatobispora TaxID=1994 RepID=A0ABW1A8C2_9ACTN|nr:hypothetical protein GCM10010200_013270 [Actinomadura rugatobispora]
MSDELLARIRATFQAIDPVPGEVLAAARSALAWRVPGAMLAENSGDAPSAAGPGVRAGGDGTRSLTFTAPGLAIELEIGGTGRTREIVGRVAPPVAARVRVRHLALVPEQPTAEADRAGQFVLPDLPEGLVSLVFLLPDDTSVVTSWIRL